MTSEAKRAARRKIEQEIEATMLGSSAWRAAMKRLVEFDREVPNIWQDD